MNRAAIWVVDRIEGDIAVLIRDVDPQPDDDARRERTAGAPRPDKDRARPRGSHPVDVPVADLPAGAGEGSVLRVPERGARPLWASAVVDDELRRSRRREAEARLRRLRRRDPGGDIVL